MPPPPPDAIRPSDEPAQWVDAYGDALFAFAISRVRRRDVAEDLVQETFLAGLTARHRFKEQSSRLTWLTGILRRKIADHYRDVEKRERSEQRDREALLKHFFNERGVWRNDVAEWPASPSDELLRDEFWEELEGCLGKLPPRLAHVYRLRELDQSTSDDVCAELSISKSNLSVRLHRARLLLRECLDKWFHA